VICDLGETVIVTSQSWTAGALACEIRLFPTASCFVFQVLFIYPITKFAFQWFKGQKALGELKAEAPDAAAAASA
jgi:hypothetical protein